ncbi:hypothetical protein K8P10_000503 [Leucobacter sp. Psy1]|uniref:DUF6264 family protein n=1 Tax=Leucobacter sp. Psy1 TaxID=2875729 RepID=UPI001CD258AB|nr:DUF6264 family protein [Leucobacter sp. Psy1]UBH04992.1 hypothetical protein K8P10_000503 [Leucobacter sp. Psy1]
MSTNNPRPEDQASSTKGPANSGDSTSSEPSIGPESSAKTEGDSPHQPRDTRPRPQYGEYAPEGWSWTPPGEESGATGPAASGQVPGSGAQAPSGSRSGRVDGVPHNLGAGSAKPARGSRSGQASANDRAKGSKSSTPQGKPSGANPAPERATPEQAAAHTPRKYRDDAATPPQAPPAATQVAAPPQARSAQGARPARKGDRIVTIILLVIGAYGAFSISSGMFNLAPQLMLNASMLDVETMTLPDWTGTAGTVTGLFVLLVWALNLLFSIQRMRAGKLAFWVPLVAAVIALVPVFIVMSVVLFQTPEVIEQFSTMPTPAPTN